MNYQSITEKLINRAKTYSANLKISVRKDKSFDVGIRNGEVEELQEASATNLSLFVNIDNKTASAATSDMRYETLETLLDNALERAMLASVDEDAIFPEYEPLTIQPDSLQLYSADITEITPEEKIQAAKDLEKRCLLDERITLSAGSGYSTNESEYLLALSNGFYGTYKTSHCSLGVYLQAGNDTTAYQDGWSDNARSPKQLRSVEEVAEIAVERATRMLGARKVATQQVPVIIDRYAAGSILGFMLECLNGRNVYMQQSVFAGKLGMQIANKNVTIYDNPLISGSLGARPFDAEGIPCRNNSIIADGVLKSYLLTTYSAKKLGMKVNGLASGTSNLFLAKGTHSQTELIHSIDKGLLLLKTLGQGTDTTTGGYSKGAYGIWIENGELTHPVSEITISGNICDMLNGIGMIGNNPDERRAWQVPSFIVDGLTISGN
ncbi:MAG: TldD/PmbA family protein [Ignavibacteria bacterium]|jgi:PmbA protein|nr:TldD/PmbA family protein [Ignavibacteria bacterium]